MSPFRRLVLLVALAISPGLAGAGTPESPDLPDPPRDVGWDVTGFSVPVPEVDLLGVWWTATDDHVAVSFRVDDVRKRSLVDEELTYFIYGRNEEYSHVSITAKLSVGTPPRGGWHFYASGCNQGPCDVTEATGRVDEQASVITVEVPASFLASDVECTRAFAVTLVRSGPRQYHAGGPVWFEDFAPNDGACGPTLRVGERAPPATV